MIVGVISDTHGNITAFRRALEFFDGADMIVHAGDVLYHPPRMCCADDYDIPAFVDTLNSLEIPIVIAQGNCDPQVYEELLKMPVQSPYAYTCWNGIRIVVNHGHLLTKDQMVDLGCRYRADYFISGHTHVPLIERVGDVTLLNPGSPAISKFEVNGKPAPSVAIVNEDGARVINIDTGDMILESGC